MRRYVLSMARFFGNYHDAVNLLSDHEFAVLAVLAIANEERKATDDYSYYSVS